jgi:hypothetical protein
VPIEAIVKWSSTLSGVSTFRRSSFISSGFEPEARAGWFYRFYGHRSPRPGSTTGLHHHRSARGSVGPKECNLTVTQTV